MKVLIECAQKRLKFIDENRLCIDRVLYCDHDNVCYHKSCYSIFTSKAIISRLKSTNKKESNESAVCQFLKWNMCIFCQEEKIDDLKSFIIKIP